MKPSERTIGPPLSVDMTINMSSHIPFRRKASVTFPTIVSAKFLQRAIRQLESRQEMLKTDERLHHRVINLALVRHLVRRRDEVKFVVVRSGDLQRRVDYVRRPKREERDGRIVRLDHVDQLLRQQRVFVPAVYKRSTSDFVSGPQQQSLRRSF